MTSAIDVDAWLDAASPRTDEVTVSNRGDLVVRHAALVEQFAKLGADESRPLDGKAADVAAEIVAVQEEMQSSLLTVKLRSIGGKWADLLAQHPPRKGDTGQDHNPETFPPAAVAACSVAPKLTIEQASRMKNEDEQNGGLSAGEWNKLWLTVVALNVVGMPRPKLAAATELLRRSDPSSTTSASEASPGASSSDDSGDPSPNTTTAPTGD